MPVWHSVFNVKELGMIVKIDGSFAALLITKAHSTVTAADVNEVSSNFVCFETNNVV